MIASLLLCCGCATTGQTGGRPSQNAMAAGAMLGGTLGNIVGGNVGYNNNGWRGGRRGSALGSVIGSIAGAAIGAAVSSAQDAQSQNSQPVEYVEVPVKNRENNNQKVSAISGLRIRTIRFIDESHTQTVHANETSKLIFDVVNESNRTVYGVVPVVEEITGNNQVSISPSTLIKEIQPQQGFRYVANIYASNDLEAGQITICIVLTDENGVEGDVVEFDLNTQN